jgi:hypothetical protein
VSNLYVYGVVEEAELELDGPGVDGADRIYTVDYRGLSAVVSDIDTTEPEQTDERVTRHNEVLQRVLEHDGGRTVVPMQFGMAFKNARTLKGVVRGSRRAFRKALNDTEGKVELGVKLVATEPADVDHDAVRGDVGARLSELAVNETDDDLFSDRLVLNRSYLVERERRDAFDDAIDGIEAEYDLHVQYTGPWAPYNFVEIHIGAEGSR